MCFVVDFALEFGRDVGVDGGGGQGGVTEEHLDGFEVHAVLQPVGGYCVADGVGRDALGEAARFQIGGKIAVDGTDSEALAVFVEEDGLGVLLGAFGVGEVAEKPVGGSLGDGGLALLFPFAINVEDEVFGVKVATVKAGELAEAKP